MGPWTKRIGWCIAQAREVTASDIKRAFRKAALKWHPDRRDGLPEQDRSTAQKRFQVAAEFSDVALTPVA